MKVYTRAEWGARQPRAYPGRRLVDDRATVHWSGEKMAGTAYLDGANEPLLPKPKQPGPKWYQLWRDPNTPKAQRRKLSRAIRKYNQAVREFNALKLDRPIPAAIVDAEMKVMRSFQNYHMDHNNWSDIGYHYVIFASGNVYAARDEASYGAHAYNANDTTGICFAMGPGEQPTHAMIDSFMQLTKAHGLTRWKGHRQVPGNATQCPGDDLIRILGLPKGY